MKIRLTEDLRLEVTPGDTRYVLSANRGSIRHAVGPGGRGLTLCGLLSNWNYTARLDGAHVCPRCRRLVEREDG